MTSPQLSLLPARSDDRLAALTAAQLAARGDLELRQRAGTEVGQGVALEPSPQVFDGVEVRRVGRQQRHLDPALGAVELLAHDAALVLGSAVPDDQQLSLELCAQGFQELHDLRALDGAVVEPEQEVRARQARHGRDVLPVEVELHYWCLAFGRPSAHSRGSLRQARFVDEDDQSPLGGTFFLSAGQVFFFHASTADSSRSIARRSGFCELKPMAPRRRQTCTSLKRTPYSRSMRQRTRLSVQSCVPKSWAMAPWSSAARSASSCLPSSCGGRPVAIERSASMPPSSSRAFHVYAVCRATPTDWAASAGVLPASINRPARTRLRVASSILVMQRFSDQRPDRVTHDCAIGCHGLGNSQ